MEEYSLHFWNPCTNCAAHLGVAIQKHKKEQDMEGSQKTESNSRSDLQGLRIGVLVENLFIPEEIEMYQQKFESLGAEVDLLTYLWGNSGTTFVSDIDGIDAKRNPNKPLQMLYVHKDCTKVSLNDYAAVLMAANYCSVRLRYFVPSPGQPADPKGMDTAPAVKFFADAMSNNHIVKGALCHGLWILTPTPQLLSKRKVICHEVVMSDVVNAGAVYTYDPSGVVVDDDLVTAHSIQECPQYIDAIVKEVLARN